MLTAAKLIERLQELPPETPIVLYNQDYSGFEYAIAATLIHPDRGEFKYLWYDIKGHDPVLYVES